MVAELLGDLGSGAGASPAAGGLPKLKELVWGGGVRC
jgi:hypothetical protein